MKGFTLIELMVVVAISAVLVGVGTVSISRVLAREKVNSAQKELISVLRLARNYAVTSQIPAGYGSQLDYVSVSWDSEGKVIAAAANLSTGVGATYFSKDVTDKEVTMTSDGVLFSVPEGKMLLNPTTPQDPSYVRTIEIKSVEADETGAVQIDGGGQIW